MITQAIVVGMSGIPMRLVLPVVRLSLHFEFQMQGMNNASVAARVARSGRLRYPLLREENGTR